MPHCGRDSPPCREVFLHASFFPFPAVLVRLHPKATGLSFKVCRGAQGHLHHPPPWLLGVFLPGGDQGGKGRPGWQEEIRPRAGSAWPRCRHGGMGTAALPCQTTFPLHRPCSSPVRDPGHTVNAMSPAKQGPTRLTGTFGVPVCPCQARAKHFPADRGCTEHRQGLCPSPASLSTAEGIFLLLSSLCRAGFAGDWAPSSNGECILAQAIGRGCFLLTTN